MSDTNDASGIQNSEAVSSPVVNQQAMGTQTPPLNQQAMGSQTPPWPQQAMGTQAPPVNQQAMGTQALWPQQAMGTQAPPLNQQAMGAQAPWPQQTMGTQAPPWPQQAMGAQTPPWPQQAPTMPQNQAGNAMNGVKSVFKNCISYFVKSLKSPWTIIREAGFGWQEGLVFSIFQALGFALLLILPLSGLGFVLDLLSINMVSIFFSAFGISLLCQAFYALLIFLSITLFLKSSVHGNVLLRSYVGSVQTSILFSLSLFASALFGRIWWVLFIPLFAFGFITEILSLKALFSEEYGCPTNKSFYIVAVIYAVQICFTLFVLSQYLISIVEGIIGDAIGGLTSNPYMNFFSDFDLSSLF
ncbi:MAG: hypothetical protein LBM69_01710 [Lachnospiraceae bacterium]|jgi:hypothetical protein|nr:hypothetical protein [Lachnospiraceae bacterium]